MSSTAVARRGTTVADVVKLLDNNKAYAAFLAPLLLAVGAAIASWISTGDFNDAEIRTAAAGAVTALVASVAAWLTSAGSAVVVDPTDPGDNPVVPPGV